MLNKMTLAAEEHFDKLEEMVKDDNNIVTVPFYAATASISLQDSQKILEKFVETSIKSGNVHATYVLNGVRADTGNFSVVQIKDEILDEETKLFATEPVSVIFSIQKTKDIDFNIISLIQPKSDSDNDPFKLGLVTGKNCVKRKLCRNALPPLPATTIKGKSSIFMKQNNLVKKENNSDIKKEKTEATLEDNKIQVNSQGSIATLFNKAAQTNAAKQDSSRQKAKQKNGGLSNFVTKKPMKEITSEKVDAKEIKKEADECPPSKTIKSEPHKEDTVKKIDLFDSDTDEDILRDLDIQDSNPRNTEVKPISKQSKTSQKRKKNPSTISDDKSAKKRKRIIVEDSESEDMFGSEESDNDIIIPLKEEPEPEKEVMPLLPKNKRRKLVKKTYEDDEGFIVTQTEYAYETASEDENEPNNKIQREDSVKQITEKKSANKSENEISPNKASKSKKANKKVPATNQSTLTSFFKRK